MNILLIANCRLGDSLVLIPTLKLLHRQYVGAHICLVSEQVGKGLVGAEEILGGRGLVDEFERLDMSGGFLVRTWKRLALFLRLRRVHWDFGGVLIPPVPPLTPSLVRRLSLYLRLSGVKRIVSPTSIAWSDDKVGLLLARLFIPDIAESELDYALPELTSPPRVQLPGGGRLLAVAPGANMPLNIWLLERFEAVLSGLADVVHPVYFGGENERGLCEKLAKLVPGTLFVGRPMAEVEAAMRQCCCYLGNDTGLMHLAAACGLRCVVVFSWRNKSHCWEPCGTGHTAFRTEVLPCAGCLAHECPLGTRECMAHHDVNAVKAAVEEKIHS